MRGLSEPIPVPDTYVSGLGGIEDIGGGNLRFYLYVMQVPEVGDGAAERIIVAKIVAPSSAIPDAIMQMITAAVTAGIEMPSAIGRMQ